MTRLHLHLLSDSTGETLDMVANACLAQFDTIETIRHPWPMVRSEGHLDRVLDDIERRPGLVLYTLVNPAIRKDLERKCRQRKINAVPVLDPVLDALAAVSGQAAKGRAGRQHALDAAYFARVDAIQFTIAHDDGVGAENWEEADIVLVGVSRTSKTPTSIYLANRGYKVANVPLVPQSPPPAILYTLKHPLIVGLTTNPERLIQIRRNRLLSLNQAPETDYVDTEAVQGELAFARRMFADKGWPVIDVTRRSIEESALAISQLHTARLEDGRLKLLLASKSEARRRMLSDAGVPFEMVDAPLDEEAAKAGLAGLDGRELAERLAALKALSAAADPDDLVLGADQTLELDDGVLLGKAASRAEMRTSFAPCPAAPTFCIPRRSWSRRANAFGARPRA